MNAEICTFPARIPMTSILPASTPTAAIKHSGNEPVYLSQLLEMRNQGSPIVPADHMFSIMLGLLRPSVGKRTRAI